MVFDVKVERRGEVARILLSGEMDVAALRPFYDLYLPLEEQDGLGLLVDLSGLSFIDSSGLHVLVDITQRAESKGRTLEIVALPESMNRLFELTRIGHLITPDQDSKLSAGFDHMDTV